MARDILLDNNGDLLITNGDLVIGESDQQHVQDLLITNPGENRSAPLLSVGLIGYLNAPISASSRQKMKKDITLKLKADGANKVAVEVTNMIKVSAKYE